MYQLGSNCCEQYISETKKPVLTQSIDHQVGGLVEKCGSSGTTEHKKFFTESLNVCIFAKFKNLWERKIRESLDINNQEEEAKVEDTIKVVNRILRDSWKPSLCKINLMT